MARTSAGTTSNYALNSTLGFSYTASDKFSIIGLVNASDYTQASFILMSRVAGGGDYMGVGLSQGTSKQIALQTISGILTISNSTIDMTGTENTWRLIGWNKNASGSSPIDTWSGACGSISGANKSTTANTSFGPNTLAANRTIMFCGWGSSDNIITPFAGKLQAWVIMLGSSLSDADIIAIGNGTKKPSQITSPSDAWDLQEASGNVIDSAGSPITLTVTGTIGTDAGPFPSGNVPSCVRQQQASSGQSF